RTGTAAGIGIFLTFFCLRNAGFIASDPVTYVRLGTLDYKALLTIVGVAVTPILLVRKSPISFLSGIFFVTVIPPVTGKINAPESLFSRPDFRTVFFKLDIVGALKLSLLPAIIGIFFTDLFDSISTFIGVAHAANLLDQQGHPRNLKQGLVVDSIAT